VCGCSAHCGPMGRLLPTSFALQASYGIQCHKGTALYLLL
jgi:hypothetical protein